MCGFLQIEGREAPNDRVAGKDVPLGRPGSSSFISKEQLHVHKGSHGMRELYVLLSFVVCPFPTATVSSRFVVHGRAVWTQQRTLWLLFQGRCQRPQE